jgi:PhnB protein
MRANAYLNFNGQCEAAMRFYEKLLGGEMQAIFPYAGTPGEEYVPAEWRGKIMHACLKFGDQFLMASDTYGEHYQPMQGMSVTLNIDDPAEADRVFAALAENGNVRMPIQETFWALRFGDVIDRFGTPWLINCSNPNFKPGEMPEPKRNVA